MPALTRIQSGFFRRSFGRGTILIGMRDGLAGAFLLVAGVVGRGRCWYRCRESFRLACRGQGCS